MAFRVYGSHDTGLYYLQSRYYDPEWGRFLNADGYTSTGQGLLGNNMFAYCKNNSVNMLDPSGMAGYYKVYSDDSLLNTFYILGTCAAGAAVTGAVLYTLVTVQQEEQVQILTQTYEQPESNENYTVYFLCAEDDRSKTIIYVGRVKTENFDSRMAYHATRGRQLVWTVSNLDYATCRAMEQAGMIYYHTINRKSSLNNRIRGISPRNKNRYTYMSAIWDLVNRDLYPGGDIIPQSFWDNLTEEAFLNSGV